MSTFEKGWPVWREHEGRRFSNHAWDPGGATKFGITLRTAQGSKGIDFDADGDGDVDARDIEVMDEPKAMEFYRQWWTRYGYEKVVDQQVATKIMDMSINMGPRGVSKKGTIYGAHVMVQKAVNKCGYALLLDGKLGTVSFDAINECEPRELLLEMCFLQTDHYRRWCDGFTNVPGDREKARAGLLERGAWPFLKDKYLSEKVK